MGRGAEQKNNPTPSPSGPSRGDTDLNFGLPVLPAPPPEMMLVAQLPPANRPAPNRAVPNPAPVKEEVKLTTNDRGEIIRAENSKGSRVFERDEGGTILRIVDTRLAPRGEPIVSTWIAERGADGKPTSTFYSNPPGKYYSGDIVQKNTVDGDIMVQAETKYDAFGRLQSFVPPAFHRSIPAGEAIMRSDGISAVEYSPDSIFVTRLVREKQATRIVDPENPERLIAVLGERPVWGATTADNKMHTFSRKFTRAEDDSVTGYVEQRLVLKLDPKNPTAEPRLYPDGEPNTWTLPEGATNPQIKRNGDLTYVDKDGATQTMAAEMDIKLDLQRQGSSNRWITKIGDREWGDTYAAEFFDATGSLIERSYSFTSDNLWHRYTRDRSVESIDQPAECRFQIRRQVTPGADGSYDYKMGDATRTSHVGGVHRNPGAEYLSETIEEAHTRMMEIAGEVFANPTLGGGPGAERLNQFRRFAEVFQARMTALGDLQSRSGIVRGREEMNYRLMRTYDSLAQLMEAPNRGDQIFSQAQRVKRAEEVMFHLQKPVLIDQGSNPTCQTAVIEIYGAEQYPNAYADFLTRGSLTGKVRFNEKLVTLPAEAVLPGRAELTWSLDTALTTSTRSPTNKFMQVGLINAYRSSQGNNNTYTSGSPWRGGFSISGASRGWLGHSIPVIGEQFVEKRVINRVPIEGQDDKLETQDNVRWVNRSEAERIIRSGLGPVAVTTMRGRHIQQLTGVFQLVPGVDAEGNRTEQLQYQTTALDNTWGNEARGGDAAGTAEWLDKLLKWAPQNNEALRGLTY